MEGTAGRGERARWAESWLSKVEGVSPLSKRMPGTSRDPRSSSPGLLLLTLVGGCGC